MGYLEDNKATKLAQPDGHWLTLNGEINYERLFRSADEYRDGPNMEWYRKKQDLIDLLADMDAGLCTMNGDCHTTEVPFSILVILIANYLRHNPLPKP